MEPAQRLLRAGDPAHLNVSPAKSDQEGGSIRLAMESQGKAGDFSLDRQTGAS